VLGTADYLAPEQAVSSSVDIRADVYSLGGTFYFMLTGQSPFPDGTIAAKLVAHQTREPRGVESYRSDVPPGMLAVLRKMLTKEPSDRYQEPIEVAEALAEWADLPLDPPPAKEMPGLCPLVLSLTGHSADKLSASGASVPLGRALFGPGRGLLRAGGSSTRHPPVQTAQSMTPRPFAARARNGPISTARNVASPTAPVGARIPADRAAAARPEPHPPVPHPRPRTGLYVALGAGFGVLFAAALAVGAFYLGKANKDGPVPANTRPGDPGPGR
jgi:serine/threonine protein kinase